ncbi:hypothetical protein F5141DRAFT_298452 [Pisolithus sp. B1]|nr:hypothetical protein F5141DRAFT_298452 [Pisolithus sp. B1]
MSSLKVTGFLPVAEGRRISSVKPNTATKTYYCVYTTALHCTGDVSFHGELRICSPFNDVALVDNTVGYVVAKAYFLPLSWRRSHWRHPVSSHCLGDPSSDTHEQSAADCLVPFVTALGSVPSCNAVCFRPPLRGCARFAVWPMPVGFTLIVGIATDL